MEELEGNVRNSVERWVEEEEESGIWKIRLDQFEKLE